MSKGCYCCDVLSIVIRYVCLCYPMFIMYAYVILCLLSYVRFNFKVRSQGLLKHVPAVHAKGNKWGGFLLCTKASVFLCTKVSVLSFPVLDGIVFTASVFALSCR